MNKKQLTVAWITIITLGIIITLAIGICFLSGWSPFLYRLHKEEGGIWKEFGIENDYVEWKITPKEVIYPVTKSVTKYVYLQGVWRANFRNLTDKKKRIRITFELLDRDNFVIVSDTKGEGGFFGDTIYLSPKENKVIEGEFEIDKKVASSAHKSQLRLFAEDIEETK